MISLNPEDLIGTLDMVKQKLCSKPWDLFVIGYGVRGTKSYTPLFEGVANASREITPSMKLAFSTAPDDVYDSIMRIFPKAE